MKFIPLASPDIREEDIIEVSEVLKTGMLVQGKKVAQLEENIASFVNGDSIIATSNGTSTLHLALLAMGIGEGDEVIVPALSYIATANVVELVKATPVFVDVELSTFNINVDLIEAAITSRTKAIMPVHEFGLCCDIERIVEIAKRNNLAVIEDAACALGATVNNKYAGTFGEFGSFSLHPRKAISSGEGGLLHTSNKELEQSVRILRNHGVEMQDGKMEFVAAGLNYRMTDFQAALVNSQLSRLDAILEKKQKLADIYHTAITNPKIQKPVVPANMVHSWQTYHVLLDDSLNRDQVIQDLRAAGIGTNYGAQCMPSQKFYQEKYNLDSAKLFPNALKSFNSGLAIPLYEKLSEEDILYIAEHLNKL